MAININDMRDFILFVANKSGRAILPTPSQFNSYVNRAVAEYTTQMFGNPQEYQPGRPIPKVSYELTQEIKDRLRHLKEVRDMLVNTEGKIMIPDGSTVVDRNGQVCPDYLHLTLLLGSYFIQGSGTITEKHVPIEVVSDDELSLLLTSELVEPTVKYPVANIEGAYLKIYPTTFQYVKMTYLRQPNTAKWSYTVQNNRPVYDPATSVDIDAPKEAFNTIAMMVLSFLGVSMRESDLVGYAEQSNAKGV